MSSSEVSKTYNLRTVATIQEVPKFLLLHIWKRPLKEICKNDDRNDSCASNIVNVGEGEWPKRCMVGYLVYLTKVLDFRPFSIRLTYLEPLQRFHRKIQRSVLPDCCHPCAKFHPNRSTIRGDNIRKHHEWYSKSLQYQHQAHRLILADNDA